MLVLPAVVPPVMTMRPSGSMEVPGQNMSWPVSVTVRADTTPVVGLNVAVWVRPIPFQLPLQSYGRYADHVRMLPLGSCAAAPGTSGKLMVLPHTPRLASGAACGASRLISAAFVHGPRLPA